MTGWGRCLLALLVTLVTWIAVVPPSAAQEPTRLRVVLVLDASGSMAANDPKKLVRVASKMLSDLADARDHVTVMSFGSTVKTLHAARGGDHEALRNAIETLGRTEMCTDYAQALEAASGVFSGAAPDGERRVVLFLTDGRFEPVGERKVCVGFDRASDEDRAPILGRLDAATTAFKSTGARVFTIGLGSAPTRAEKSAAVLRDVASKTGGRFLVAQGPRDVPPIFAQIFGGLVGAPVMRDTLERGRQAVDFTVPKGADGVHVVLVPDRPSDLDDVKLTRDGAQVGFEPPRIEKGTSSSYRLARITDAASGTYRLEGRGAGRIDVLVIPDVGLSLRIEGIPKVIAEGETLKGRVGLRTRLGDPVALTPDFLQHVKLTVSFGESTLFDARPDGRGVAAIKSTTPLKRGRYRISASASHGLGFLDVPEATLDFAVEPRFAMELGGGPVTFDTMAEEGPIPLADTSAVTVVAPKAFPVEVTVTLSLPEEAAGDLELTPTTIAFGPDAPRRHAIGLTWKTPRDLRGRDARYEGVITLVPDADAAKLLVGAKSWSVPLDGTLRAWTWKRYFEEYKWHLLVALLLLLLVVWLVGRAMAQKFPPKARIYHVEVGQDFESDSRILRYAAHGAYRNAKFKFPLGKKARPLVWFESTGSGFTVIPGDKVTVTVMDDTLAEDDRTKTAPFRGSWQQRYRLDDRFEVYLTRDRLEEPLADGGGSSGGGSSWA